MIGGTGVRLLLSASFLAAGCSPSSGPTVERNFGQHPLASLDTECEGKPGLIGQAILDVRTALLQGQLSYVTAAGAQVDPTALTIEVTWPATPVATCYPRYQVDAGPVTEARVAIEGLTLRFKTADGRFDETLTSKAWLLAVGSQKSTSLLAVAKRSSLSGSWQPFPEYASAGDTLLFYVGLSTSGKAAGNTGLSQEDPAELNAAILRSRFAVTVFQ